MGKKQEKNKNRRETNPDGCLSIDKTNGTIPPVKIDPAPTHGLWDPPIQREKYFP